jgi:hypothetical protein
MTDLCEMALHDEQALDVLVDVLIDSGELALCECEHADEQRAIALSLVGINMALVLAMHDDALNPSDNENGDGVGYGNTHGNGHGDGLGYGYGTDIGGCYGYGDGENYGNGNGDGSGLGH